MTPPRPLSIIPTAALALLLSACATTTTSTPTEPAAPKIDRTYTSVAQDSRALFIVLHYTALDWEKSLKVLATGGQVSAHYLVRDEPAAIYQLVDENRRAWHAGASFWAGHSNLNSSSIGIEIVNSGYLDTEFGRIYPPYPQAQVDQIIALVRDIAKRHNIRPERIIGHSDIAPGRKQDPGPSFPWPDAVQVAAKIPLYAALPPDAAWFQDKLTRFGYSTSRSGIEDELTKATIATFQSKYRPRDWSGAMDAETAALLDVATSPGGMLLAKSNAATEPKPLSSRF